MREQVLRDAFDVVARLVDLRNVATEADFHDHVATSLAPLLPGDWTASERYRFDPYGAARNRVQHQSGTVFKEFSDKLYDAFKPHAAQHVFFADVARLAFPTEAGHVGPTGIITMSAFERRGRNFQQMGLYRDVYRHMNVTHQTTLAFKLAENDAVMVTYSSDKPFSKEHEHLLQLVAPHIKAVWQNYAWQVEVGVGVDASLLTADALQQRFSIPPRRAQVLAGIARGHSNKQIAHSLGLSLGTIRKHVELLLSDLNVASRHAAAVLAHQSSPPPEASCDLMSEP